MWFLKLRVNYVYLLIKMSLLLLSIFIYRFWIIKKILKNRVIEWNIFILNYKGIFVF